MPYRVVHTYLAHIQDSCLVAWTSCYNRHPDNTDSKSQAKINCGWLTEIQLSLSLTATLGAEENGHCREVAIGERFKQESMYGLSTKKCGCCRELAVVERWLLVEVFTVGCKLPLLQTLANEDTDSRLTIWKYHSSPSGLYMYLRARLAIANVIYLLYSILPILDSFQMKLLHYQDSLKLLSC